MRGRKSEYTWWPNDEDFMTWHLAVAPNKKSRLVGTLGLKNMDITSTIGWTKNTLKWGSRPHISPQVKMTFQWCVCRTQTIVITWVSTCRVFSMFAKSIIFYLLQNASKLVGSSPNLVRHVTTNVATVACRRATNVASVACKCATNVAFIAWHIFDSVRRRVCANANTGRC